MIVNKEIVIDLGKPLLSGGTDSDSNLQKKAMNKVKKTIEGFVAQAEFFADAKNENKRKKGDYKDFETPRHNNTIFISGQRGSGKTTFIKSVLTEYDQNIKSKAFSLVFIDPTLVETKENILVQIVCSLNDAIKEELKCCKDDQNFHDFRQSLEDVADGLRLLNNAESNGKWTLSDALNNSEKGRDLEKNLGKLFEISCGMLGTEIFIIAFDDVDTDDKHAYDVLEIMRKYLTSPRCCVLLTGDMSLYSYTVRLKKAKSLADKNIGIDLGYDDKTKSKMVAHLEQQYLSKILPEYNRINLESIKDLYKNIIIKYDPIFKNKPFLELLTNLVHNDVCSSKLQTQKYVDFLLTTPIRSILHISKYCLDAINDDKSMELKDITGLDVAFIHSFYGDLAGFLDESLLKKEDVYINKIAYYQFLNSQESSGMETGFYLRPDSISHKSNIINLALLLILIRFLKEKETNSEAIGAAFSFMLSSGGTSNFFMNEIDNNNDLERSKLLIYLGLNRIESAYYIGCHLGGLLSLPNSGYEQKKGVIGVYQRRQTNNDPANKKFKESYENIFEETELNQSNIHNLRLENTIYEDLSKNSTNSYSNKETCDLIVASLLMATSKMERGSNSVDHVSIFSFIGAIFDLLSEKKPDSENIAFSLATKLQNNNYGSTYNKINENKKDSESQEADSGLDQPSSEDEKHSLEKLSKKIEIWISNTNKLENARTAIQSSVLLGKIWTRFYYSVSGTSEDFSKIKETDGAYVLLHQAFRIYIISFLNAILVEEAINSPNVPENITQLFFGAKNPRTSYIEFFNNLKKLIGTNSIEKIKDHFPIFYCFLSCPFIVPYWASITIDQAALSQILSQLREPIINEYSIIVENFGSGFSEISRVQIKKRNGS